MTDQIISHYRLVRKLGSGAFGEVWEGVHIDFEEMRVAVKLLHMDLARDEGFVQRLKQECLTLHTLQHPNIVGFRDLVLSGDRPAMVMELVEGEDAFELVQQGGLSPERVLVVGRDALTGLSFAHQKGVIHRDIKPSNLFVCEDGTTKLLDFGIAKAADGTNATRTGTIQGTLQYIAPEQFSGTKANASSDLYALGLSIVELLTGQPACPVGAMPEQFAWHLTKGLKNSDRGTIPVGLWSVLLKLAATEASDRYSSAAEALAAWNAVALSSEAVSSASAPATPPSTVSLDLAEASKLVDGRAAQSLPPQSVVMSLSEVEQPLSTSGPLIAKPSSEEAPESGVRKPSGGGKGFLFGGLGVLALVGGYFAYGSMVQSGLSSNVEAIRIEAEGFGLFVPSAPYDEDSVSDLESELARKRVRKGELESLISSVEVSGGRFIMGCLPSDGDCDSDEKPRHEVVISHDMIVMRTEVTQGLYESVMGQNPSYFSSCGKDCPVEQVSWYDAVRFANKLSEEMVLSKCYEINGEEVSWSDGNCIGWRLPTEAEWEYLAGGGGDHKYSGSDSIGDVAWYNVNSGSEAHSVGQKQANGFGLYDMTGNVWEWTWDWYGDYSSSSVTDPRGPSSGSYRVRRGGSLNVYAGGARVSNRFNFGGPSSRALSLGFRLVRNP